VAIEKLTKNVENKLLNANIFDLNKFQNFMAELRFGTNDYICYNRRFKIYNLN
jgi:hypothetical protein